MTGEQVAVFGGLTNCHQQCPMALTSRIFRSGLDGGLRWLHNAGTLGSSNTSYRTSDGHTSCSLFRLWLQHADGSAARAGVLRYTHRNRPSGMTCTSLG